MIATQKFASPIARTQAVRVRFGFFELDPRSGELFSGQARTIVPQQPFQILLMLIERDGEIVGRDEIQKRLWSDDVIVDFDVSINQAIRKLRRLLDDSAEEPQYIETVGRRGYRLMVPVEWTGKPPLVSQPSNLDSIDTPGRDADELALFWGGKALHEWLSSATASEKASVLQQLLDVATRVARDLSQQAAFIDFDPAKFAMSNGPQQGRMVTVSPAENRSLPAGVTM